MLLLIVFACLLSCMLHSANVLIYSYEIIAYSNIAVNYFLDQIYLLQSCLCLPNMHFLPLSPTAQMIRKFEARGMLRKDAEVVVGKLAQYENIFVGAMVSALLLTVSVDMLPLICGLSNFYMCVK